MRSHRLRFVAGVLASLALLAASCGDAGDTADGESPTVVTSSADAGSDPTPSPTDEPPPSPTDAPDVEVSASDSDGPAAADGITTTAEGEPVDYLAYGAGAFPVRFDPETQGGAAQAILDGNLGFASLSNSPTGPEDPLVVTIEFPVATTILQFAVPPMSSFGCCSGTHIDTVTVEGADGSPDGPWQQLASFQVAPEEYDDNQVFEADVVTPVRWVRVTLDGRQVPDPDDYRGTSFTELMAWGTQEPVVVQDGTFTGRWLTGGGGGENGNRIELIQNGSLVTGCGTSGGSAYTVSGGIENGLLRYVVNGDTIPTVAVITSEDQLAGALIGRSFPRVIGNPGGAETDCSPTVSEAPPNPVADALASCETAILYGINFDVDKDDIRPDAEPALGQILDAMNDNPDVSIVVEGHTDSDGSDEYNADLSDRRAAAVVGWLTDAGIDASRMGSVGKGEAEPIATNDTSAGKASNRRVEIEPC